ncbi:MAG: hypothetical protein KGI67_00190 [Pseudomonadota bacterium]|nr:hypothetical protein [Pseudomonadota bacterium]
MRLTTNHAVICMTTALVLAACGGGSGSGSSATSSAPAATAAAARSTSSGTLTAFGSVFVNGHEFSTASAKVFDDDVSNSSTATLSNTNASSNGLTVGMTVDVKAADDSSSAAPHAGEIHIHPLARGYIDASNTSAGTLQIMGQTVALSSSTVFRDDRACVSASTCTAITAQSQLLATDQSCAVSGSGFQNQGGGSTFTPGRYAQVFGLLSTSSSGASTIQATLVRFLDAGATPVFKAEGSVTAVGMGTPPASFMMGGLSLDPSVACTAAGSCAFSAGALIAARGSAMPTITCGPAAINVAFKPDVMMARHAATLTSGSTVELEGLAANVVSTATPATFTLDGVTIQVGSGLTLPAAGDRVEVLGTVNSDLSITATSISTEESHAQQGTPFLIQDTLVSGAVTGSAAPYDLSILGTHVVLDAHTRFIDRTASMSMMSGSNPFNVMTAGSYLNGLSGPSVVVVGYQDTSTTPATFHAVALEVVAPTSNVRLGGVVTGALGTGSSLQVDGLTVAVGSGTTVTGMAGTAASIAVGDFVLVTGSETLTGSSVTGVSASTIKDFGNNPMHGD